MIEKFVSSFDNFDDRLPNVLCSMENGVAVVAIANTSARNALSLKMWKDLETIFRDLSSDASVRIIVLRGAGTEAFAAGADISEFPELRFTASSAAVYNAQLSRTLRRVAEIEIPTIAMLQGFTVGGGCELAAACDLRIAADDLSIGIPVGRLGVILGLTESRLLVRHIGVNGLKRLLFSGELVGAEQALGMGLVDEVVPAAELNARVSTLAAAVRASSATVMTAAKVITDLAGTLDDAAADRVQELSLRAYDGADLREGVSAFLEKRRPVFAGGVAEGEPTR
ncbi:enoyl-CoA hydratase/isomerase family protein [Arthrobacter sp. ZGTC212]|uniref:enoyl-CoA hydratase/isomerase family protein n=1 Tax=Arthrobacter sp. ZGTC212 TaxID=2058899 RepID=UPI000CE3F0BE|nr:enoyl-CoA hydratase-related protein [Arthrobacter sp. ZGTC212]